MTAHLFPFLQPPARGKGTQYPPLSLEWDLKTILNRRAEQTGQQVLRRNPESVLLSRVAAAPRAAASVPGSSRDHTSSTVAEIQCRKSQESLYSQVTLSWFLFHLDLFLV